MQWHCWCHGLVMCVPAVAELGPFCMSPTNPLHLLPHYILPAVSLIFKKPCCMWELSQHHPALFYGVPSPYPQSGECFWANAREESEEQEHPWAGILDGSSCLSCACFLASVGGLGAGAGRPGWYGGVHGVVVLPCPLASLRMDAAPPPSAAPHPTEEAIWEQQCCIWG